MNVQEVVNSFWAVAILGVEDPLIWGRFSHSASSWVDFFTPQHSSMCLQAASHLLTSRPHPSFPIFFDSAVKLVGAMNLTGTCTTLWASSHKVFRLSMSDDKYFRGLKNILSAVANVSSQLTSSQIVQIVCSFQIAGIFGSQVSFFLRHTDFYDPKEFSSKQLVSILHSFAVVRFIPSPVILKRLLEIVDSLTFEEICLSVWSVSCFSLGSIASSSIDDSLWSGFRRNILRYDGEISAISSQQLLQGHLMEPLLPESIKKKCLNVMLLSKQFATISLGQRQLAAVLTQIGFNISLETSIFEGIVSLDILATRRSKNYAVEFDGPSHFLLSLDDEKRSYNGAALLRNKIIEKSGYSLVLVDYALWDLLPTEESKKTYLDLLFA